MPGETAVPVVLLGRYTTLTGSITFRTLPINAVPYDSFELVAWRGDMPTDATFQVAIEGSMDQETWVEITSGDPGSDQELGLEGDLTMSWLRATVTLATTGLFPVVSCYLVGTLLRRASR